MDNRDFIRCFWRLSILYFASRLRSIFILTCLCLWAGLYCNPIFASTSCFPHLTSRAIAFRLERLDVQLTANQRHCKIWVCISCDFWYMRASRVETYQKFPRVGDLRPHSTLKFLLIQLAADFWFWGKYWNYNNFLISHFIALCFHCKPPVGPKKIDTEKI